MFGPKLHIKKDNGILFWFFLAFLLFSGSLSAQQTEVAAEKGEGIYRLLIRNGYAYPGDLEKFIELNRERLGPGNILYAGRKYKLPSKAEESETETKTTETANEAKTTIRRIEIFGKEHADVQIIDNQLKGTVYYLVAGHGGPDPGAVGIYGNMQLCEDEYAYDVTLRLARNLIQHGATVYMITHDPNDGIRNDSYLKPDKDELCYPRLRIPLNQMRRLKQRTDAVNSLYQKNRGSFQRMVAIHVDSRSRGENIDVFFYHDRRSTKGRKAAKILQKTFQNKYDEHQPGRGYNGTVSDRNLYVVRNTRPVAVYIELGNINHHRDQQRFIISSNRQALANWLFEGLTEDYQTNK
jgi:N-acetylmuramoyl-L-alanine amidase